MRLTLRMLSMKSKTPQKLTTALMATTAMPVIQTTQMEQPMLAKKTLQEVMKGKTVNRLK